MQPGEEGGTEPLGVAGLDRPTQGSRGPAWLPLASSTCRLSARRLPEGWLCPILHCTRFLPRRDGTRRAEHVLPVPSQLGRGKPAGTCAAASAQGAVCSLSLRGMVLAMRAGLGGQEGRVAGLVFMMRLSRPPPVPSELAKFLCSRL